MATVRLKYVYRDRDRQGRVRWRFRKPGCKAMTLRGAYGSPEFMANYQTVISEVEPIPKKGLGIAKAGTIAALRPIFYDIWHALWLARDDHNLPALVDLDPRNRTASVEDSLDGCSHPALRER
jgi:hypothetical protein